MNRRTEEQASQSDDDGKYSAAKNSQTTITTTTASDGGDEKSGKGSTSASSKKEEDMKNLQVLFGALLQYDRFNNGTNNIAPQNNNGQPQQPRRQEAASAASPLSAPNASRAPTVIPVVSSSPSSKKANKSHHENHQHSSSKTEKYSAAAAKSLANFLCPPDKDVRETNLYQSTYRLLQWQRDNYMVGPDFANWRRQERVQEKQEQEAASNNNGQPLTILRRRPTATAIKPLDYRDMLQQLPPYYDVAARQQALGPVQLANIARDFIPSTTVQQAALPLVVPLFGGPALYPTTQQALVSLILGQQGNLNGLMKSSILTYLNNPDNRRAMKKSTKGYMIRNENNSNNSSDEPTGTTSQSTNG